MRPSRGKPAVQLTLQQLRQKIVFHHEALLPVVEQTGDVDSLPRSRGRAQLFGDLHHEQITHLEKPLQLSGERLHRQHIHSRRKLNAGTRQRHTVNLDLC